MTSVLRTVSRFIPHLNWTNNIIKDLANKDF